MLYHLGLESLVVQQKLRQAALSLSAAVNVDVQLSDLVEGGFQDGLKDWFTRDISRWLVRSRSG